jgi:hypothetical protein
MGETKIEGTSAVTVDGRRNDWPDAVDSRNTHRSWLPQTRRVIRPRCVLVDYVPPEYRPEHVMLEARIAMVAFDATALPIDDIVFEARIEGICLSIRMLVPNREAEDLSWIQIWRNLLCPWQVLRIGGPDQLVRWMRETIANVVAHEVDESITLRGERVFDPHRPLLSVEAAGKAKEEHDG